MRTTAGMRFLTHPTKRTASHLGDTNLMCVKINYHGLLHFNKFFKQKADGQSYVGVNAKTSTVIAAAMVESAPDVDCPASFNCQLRGLETD
jgi:hypothetical protein